MPTVSAADQDQHSIFSVPYWAMATESGLACCRSGSGSNELNAWLPRRVFVLAMMAIAVAGSLHLLLG
jgi:hypothetical protein